MDKFVDDSVDTKDVTGSLYIVILIAEEALQVISLNPSSSKLTI